jgi:hypothetical protein
MKIPSWDSGKIQKGFEWRCQNRAKSTILGHFLGIFEIFRGGKGTPDHKTRKIYLLDILPPHQSKQFFLGEFFPDQLSLGDSNFSLKIQSLEKMQKGQSWKIHIDAEVGWNIKS